MATRAAARPSYRCDDCGATATKWVGRCPQCQAWGTLSETGPAAVAPTTAGPVTTAALPLSQVDATLAVSRPTGIGELDRVLGGGLVPGAVVLLAGEPGVGKSTLLLEVAAAAARSAGPQGRSLIVTGEESTAQVRLRAGRTGTVADGVYLAAETDLAALLGHVDAVAPSFLVVDSVQTIASAQVDGSAGGVTQIRAVTAAVIAVAKARGIATFLVGHVTKEGTVAGPRVLEHLVDVVLHFEGDRHSPLRLLRTVKNRYGPADEVGCFELTEGGIRGVPDPSGLFLTGSTSDVPGTCLTVVSEGRRALLAEVQALVGGNPPNTTPRRSVSGLDAARVSMIAAVLERRGQVKIAGQDIYASSVGGVKVLEPAADLALALALASACHDRALAQGTVALGELGLTGEVRTVQGLGRRLAEAARLGRTHALVPPGSPAAPRGMRLTEVTDLGAALRVTGLAGSD